MKFNRSVLALGISFFFLPLRALETRLDLSLQPYSSATQPPHLFASHHKPKLFKRARDWTGEEEKKLVELRDGGLPWAEVLRKFPERTYWSLVGKYYKLKPNPSARARADARPWTPEEDERLQKLLERKQEMTWKEMATYFPGRTPSALKVRKISKDIPPTGRIYHFTKEEDDLLLELGAKKMSWKERAKRFPNRDVGSLKGRYRLLVPPGDNLVQPWTPGEDKTLIEAVELRMSWKEIAELLNRKIGGVQERARTLTNSGRINTSPLKHKHYTGADFDLMREKREEGMSWSDIARQYFPGRPLTAPKQAYLANTRKQKGKGEAE